jgi:phosphoserine phosphatase RsbU/P
MFASFHPLTMHQALIREYQSHRMARFAFWTALAWILLHLVDAVTNRVPVALSVLVWIAVFVALVYYLVRLIRFIRRRLLWRLSRRLAVTYVFIAFVPVALILLLVFIGVMIVNGQFAAFLVNVRLRNRFDELRQLNRVVAHQAIHTTTKTPQELIGQLQRFYEHDLKQYAASYPGLAITVRVGSQARAFTLTGEPLANPVTVPRWFAHEEWDGVVTDGGGLSLRAVDRENTPAGRLALILSMPITPALLSLVGGGIGPVELYETMGNRSRFPPRAKPHPQVIRSSFLQLPRRLGWFDLPVGGLSEINPVEWQASHFQQRDVPAILAVSSRIFTLNGQLLSTLGRRSGVIEDVFVAICIVFLVIELIALIIGMTLTRTITSTVNRLQMATEKVKTGDFSHRIGLPPRDQLSALGGAFDSMTASVERLLAESREKTRLEGELKIAREVQAQLFPRAAPELPGITLYGMCRPARGVSGDYYDFLKLDQDHVGLVLGDVSGKGIFAALLMAAIQSAVHAQFYDGYIPGGSSGIAGVSPASLVKRLNRQLCASTSEEKYATFFYAVYDAPSRTLTYTNAGHPAPFLFRGEALVRLDRGGTVLGLFPNADYEQTQVQVERGDLLLAFTDGLTEPENSFAEEFGERRLIGAVRQDRDSPPASLMEQIYRRINDWTGSVEPQDDMTMLYLKALV